MLNSLARFCDAVAFGFSHGSMAVWYGVTKRLFDFVSPMRRGGVIGSPGASAFWLMAVTVPCVVTSSVLSKVCVVRGKENKRALLQERWHIQPLELLCVLHYYIDKGCFHDQGTAVGSTVTLCIEEISQIYCFLCRGGWSGPIPVLGGFP